MAAVKAHEVDAVLKRSGLPPALLFYGPDAGLVAERAKAAAEAFVEDPADAFQLVRLDGDALAAAPARLCEEAATIGLFGARRAIWVRPTGRNIAAAVLATLDIDLKDTRVVIEAGDLAKTSPLRTACEKSARALALPCYADNERALGTLIDEVLTGAGLTIDRDARATLLAGLGGDRLASRGEVEKLALYCRGGKEVTLADIDAVLSDVSALTLDALVDASFLGQRQSLDDDFGRNAAEGVQASATLGAALRHALALVNLRETVDRGGQVSSALESARAISFRRRGAVEAQLGMWSAKALDDAVRELQSAILESRRQADLGQALARHTLLRIAVSARGRRGARG